MSKSSESGPDISKKIKKDKPESITKAAKMILALGEENAVEILKHLDGESIEKIISEMVLIKHVESAEKITLIQEFKKNLEKIPENFNGVREAEIFLEKSLGKEKAAQHIENAKKNLKKLDFSEIEKYPAENCAHILIEELPQTSAFLLTSVKPGYAAKVMAKLDNAYRVSVARKIATMTKVSPDIIRLAYETILDKLKKMDEHSPDLIEGENKLLEILNHMDISMENKLLESLSSEDPEMTDRLKEKLRVFEDIIQLTPKELRKVFDKIPDHVVWAKALKGAGQNITRHIFSSISMNRASDIMSEMNFIKEIPLKEIEKNRKDIMNIISDLEKNGKLVLRKDKDQLVE